MRGFSHTLGRLGAESLHACVNDDVGVHFAESVAVASELRFEDVDSELAGS